ncbi:hypothetical protein [Vibrio salilacus]|uniref:hypothetical protein n=1 Tax=Vibrio salilacus TaxID=1323749 RepID=UPI0012FE62F0|nr:hypothetical protein [Vibrio salilacus]
MLTQSFIVATKSTGGSPVLAASSILLMIKDETSVIATITTANDSEQWANRRKYATS